jgi:anthranilate phosphoribosyltransferase
MKTTLQQLFEQRKLSESDAYDVLTRIGNGEYNSSQIAAFITVFMMRNISTEELNGFRNALLDLCLKVDLSDFNTIDVCGTGGDGQNTFNISTLSAFVLAGAGYKVAKHGNYGVSSSCGSSNVLEYLGYEFTNNESKLQQQIDTTNFCMMHAPLFHPAMKNVAPIRKELGMKTFFNLLGPLVNPSLPQHQLVGVFNLEIARTYNYLLQNTDKQYTILHSLDGYDEISLTGKFKTFSNTKESLLNPEDIGLMRLTPSSIYGGESVSESAKIFLTVLNNTCSLAQKNVVLANSAFAIKVFEPEQSFTDCFNLAKESIESGKAYQVLKKITH